MPTVPKRTVRVFCPLEEKAAKFRQLAQIETNEKIRKSLVAIARHYEETISSSIGPPPAPDGVPMVKRLLPLWGSSVVPPMSAKVLAMMAALVAQMLAAMPDYDVDLALASLMSRTNVEDIAVKDSGEFQDSGFSTES